MAYRPVSQSEFANFYQFPATHMQWAARNSLAAHEAQGLGNSPSADALKSFLIKSGEHIQTRRQVLARQNGGVNASLVAADRKVDATYARFVERIRTEPDLYGRKSSRGKAALRLLRGPLALPIPSVTNVDRVEEEGLLKAIIAEIDANHLADIATLEFGALYRLLKDDMAEFVRQMSVDSQDEKLPSRSALEEDRRHLQALMLGCIYRILGMYPDPIAEDLEMRTHLLGPFAIQNDRIGEYHRRRRGHGAALPPDADPETGEFDEFDDSGEDIIEEVLNTDDNLTLEDTRH